MLVFVVTIHGFSCKVLTPILSKRPQTIRRRLLSDLVLLLVLAGGTILVATWILGARTIEDLSRSLIDRSARRTESELQQFFGTVHSNVLTTRDWAAGGILDATDHERMNTLFVPILKQHPRLSSMMVADSDGAEYLLMRDPLDPDVWTNRVVQADRRGNRVLNRKWNTATGELEEEFGELDYDPRKRIWYEQALLTTVDDPVFWTDPVIFFITKDPGITASAHYTIPGESARTLVVAYDLLLMDISKFTSNLQVSDRGKAFVLVEERNQTQTTEQEQTTDQQQSTDQTQPEDQEKEPGGSPFKVVGLPMDERFQDVASIRDALVFVPPEAAVADSAAQLPSPDIIQIPALSAAMQTWQGNGRPQQPVRFEAEGEHWWGGFRRFELGENVFWISVVVPEGDLSSDIRFQQGLLMVIVLGVLSIGMLRAISLANRFSTPIEALVKESERIARGDLKGGKAIASNVSEIRRLADAQDDMREGLKSVIKLEKLERDLDIAKEIQVGLLPDEPPDTPGFKVAGWNRPADQTGGDYFDWLALPDGRTLFTLADVTGHGIGPALIVAVYRAYMRASASSGPVALNTVFNRVNELLIADIPDGRFITAVIGLIDPTAFQVDLLSAGHAPLLFYEAATETVHNWDADDLPLGITDGVEFSSGRQIHFLPGDMLVLITDGFFEATNAADEQYGIDALERFIRENHRRTPDEFIGRLYRQVKKHADGEAQADDLTALVIKRIVDRPAVAEDQSQSAVETLVLAADPIAGAAE
jgi:hypothetical protein